MRPLHCQHTTRAFGRDFTAGTQVVAATEEERAQLLAFSYQVASTRVHPFVEPADAPVEAPVIPPPPPASTPETPLEEVVARAKALGLVTEDRTKDDLLAAIAAAEQVDGAGQDAPAGAAGQDDGVIVAPAETIADGPADGPAR